MDSKQIRNIFYLYAQLAIKPARLQLNMFILFIEHSINTLKNIVQDLLFINYNIIWNYFGQVFTSISSSLIKIQQELLHLHPTYNILSARDDDSDRQLAVLKQKFAFPRANFDIDSAYSQYALEGLDPIAHTFTITKNGQAVAIVSRQFFSIVDTYGVEIVGDEDQAFILALVIILDEVLHGNVHQNNN